MGEGSYNMLLIHASQGGSGIQTEEGSGIYIID